MSGGGPPVVEGRPRWGLGDAAAGYAVAFLLTGVTLGAWASATGERDMTLSSLVVGLVAQWVGLVGAVVVASRLKGSGRLQHDFGFRLERQDVLPGMAVGLVSQFALLPLLYLPFRLLDANLDVSGEARRLTSLGRGPGLVLLALCVVVGSPVVEELFFRGLLQRSLARRFGAGWAVAGSSLAFGLVHAQPVQLLGLVAFGVVLAVLAQRSGRLGPALVAHASFNAATVALLVASR